MIISAESRYYDRLIKLGSAVLVDATRVTLCSVRSMTLYYVPDRSFGVWRSGEMGRGRGCHRTGGGKGLRCGVSTCESLA